MDRLPEMLPVLEQLYYHEAGHAAVAFILGAGDKIEAININALETYGVTSFDHDIVSDYPDAKLITEVNIPEVVNKIIIGCAGDVAEFLFTGKRLGHDDSDYASSFELLSDICPREKLPGNIIACWNIALRILKQPQNWFAVEQLVAALFYAYNEQETSNWGDGEFDYDFEYDDENRQLDGDKVRQIIKEALDLSSQLQKRKKVSYREC
jgi:hypothetical protein